MDIATARILLNAADVFFEDDNDGCYIAQMININDAMYWARADGEFVSDDDLGEVADLFIRYGWCGIIYWVSKKREWERAEFLDVNRMIDFVKNEEELREKTPDNSERAYKKITYTLGG